MRNVTRQQEPKQNEIMLKSEEKLLGITDQNRTIIECEGGGKIIMRKEDKDKIEKDFANGAEVKIIDGEAHIVPTKQEK